MKKVIVTGGLGFIGSHLVDMLLGRNIEVTIVDDQRSSAMKAEEYNSCRIYNTINDAVLWAHNVDAVFHLASVVGPAGVLSYAGEMGEIVEDVIAVRDYCIKERALFVYVSTSEIYGQTGLLAEDMTKIFPGEYQIRTEYGAAKMLGEIITVNKARVTSDLKYHIIRPFNVSGPRQQPNGGFVLPRFIIAALKNKPMTIFWDGLMNRAFTDVRDVCDGIFAVIESGLTNEIWNIGNIKNKMEIKQLAVLVKERVEIKCPGLEVSYEYVNPKDIYGDLFSEAIDKIPDVSKMHQKTNWRTKILIEQTIDDLIDYYMEKL